MAFFNNLSNTLWSYLTPRKPDAAREPATEKAPRLAKPTHSTRRRTISDHVRSSHSMSPTELVESWHSASGSHAVKSLTAKKRSHSRASATSTQHRRKSQKTHHDLDYVPETDADDADSMEDEVVVNKDVDNDSEMSNIDVSASTPALDNDEADDEEASGDEIEQEIEGDEIELASGDALEDDDDAEQGSDLEDEEESEDESEGDVLEDDDDASPDIDQSLVATEEEWAKESESKKKIIAYPKELEARGITKDELRAAGWDDDHITLVQKITMRGYEPLLPKKYVCDFTRLPDALFSADENAFISCVNEQPAWHGSKALGIFCELGPRVREAERRGGFPTPEIYIERKLREYQKWADKDSGLSWRKNSPTKKIDTFVIVTAPVETPPAVMQERALRKLRRTAAQFREALQARHSIEVSPGSASESLTANIPTLYAFIASHTIVALVAYRAELDTEVVTEDEIENQGEDGTRVIAFFDMMDVNHDVWNCLALAIVVCHARNVEMRIAQDTGIGVLDPAIEPEIIDLDL